MPSIEQSERLGGAVFLGVPAFDFFVWALDDYARLELLVRLHEHLPPFLLSPATAFICMCVGLGFLYLAHKKQLERLAAASQTRRILDSSGALYSRDTRPNWLLPVGVIFLVAMLAAPLIAVAYSLAYQGSAPPLPVVATPPTSAYSKTQLPRSGATQSQPHFGTIQSCPNGICIGGGTVTNPTVNNYEPAHRTLSEQQRTKFISSLKQKCPFEVAVRPVTGNAESMEFADSLSAAIEAAGCRLGRAKFLIDTKPFYGTWVMLHDASSIPAGADALAEAFFAAGIPVKSSVTDFIEPGRIYLMVGLNDTKQKQ